MVFLCVVFGAACILYGAAAFWRIPKFNYLTTYWDAERFNSSKFKRFSKKLTAVACIFFGFLMILGGALIYVDERDEKESARLDQIESSALGISVENYKIYKSALFYLPKDTTYAEYQQLDAAAKASGFKNANQYLLINNRANKAGVTIEQYVQQHPTEATAVSDGTSFIVIPMGSFHTDRGQVSRAVYKLACQKATPEYYHTALSIKFGYSSYPQGKLIENLGESAISQAKIWWDENHGCLGSFVVSGMVNGSNHIIPLQGKVESFDNINGSIIGTIRTY